MARAGERIYNPSPVERAILMETRDAPGGLLSRSVLSAVLALGLAVAGTLTLHHENQVYGDASVVLSNCPETETINCNTVNTSEWSEVMGVPIAAFAIPTYLIVLVLVWKSRRRPGDLAQAFAIGLLA